MSLLYKVLIFKIFKIFIKNIKSIKALTLIFKTFDNNLRNNYKIEFHNFLIIKKRKLRTIIKKKNLKTLIENSKVIKGLKVE